MDLGGFLLALGGVASVVTLLGYLGFAPNGPQILQGIKARVEAPRKQREAQQGAIARLQAALADEQALSAQDHERFDTLLAIVEKDHEAQEARFQGLEQQIQEVASAVAELGTLIEGIRMPEQPEIAERWEVVQRRLADLEVSESKWLRGTFDHSPEAQRIQRSAKEHVQDRRAAYPLGDPRNALGTTVSSELDLSSRRS